MPEAAIEVHDLRKTYRDGLLRRRTLAALRGITLQVDRGEIFGLLGPNGAGKTTLIKILLGIVRDSGGRAMLLGLPAGHRQARRRVGYLPENLRLPKYLSALTALDYFGRLSGMAAGDIRGRGEELLASVGLADRRRDSVGKYSKGMMQRLGLAQALLHDPELLILDEPTDGLDPVGRSYVRSVLLGLKQAGKTVFLNSHILQEVELICDRVAILDQGQLRRIGSVEELASSQSGDLQLQLELQGDESRVREALASHRVTAWQALEPGSFRVELALSSQSDVDRCVDGLRLRQVSIRQLSRRRLSLEEAFLSVLAESLAAPVIAEPAS